MEITLTLTNGAEARRRKQPRKNAREDLYKILNGRNKATKHTCTAQMPNEYWIEISNLATGGM